MDLIARLQTYYLVSAANQDNGSIPVVAPLLPNHPTNTPIMVCTAETFMPATMPELEFIVLSSQSSITAVRETLDTNARGFDPEAALGTDAEAAAFRTELITNRAVTAILDGQPVAAGMFTPPIDSIAELVGITTLTPYRGRGIGAALTSELVRLAFKHGVDSLFLYTDNPTAYRVYERLGFQTVAVLHAEQNQKSAIE